MTSTVVEAASKNDLPLLEYALAGELGPYEQEDLDDGLIRAVKVGYIETAERLLDAGADPDSEDLDGYTPLMLAATNNFLRLAKLMIQRKCDLNLTNDRGRTALHCAVWTNRVGIVKLLVRAGCECEMRERYGDTPVMLCAKRGSDQILKFLLKKGCNLNTKSLERDTALHYCAQYGHISCMDVLLEYDTLDMEAKNIWGYTPLLVAVMCSNDQAARKLMEHGATFHDVQDRSGMTVLHHAVKQNLVGCVQELLIRGATPDAMASSSNNTPLMLATYNNYAKAARLLIQANCNVELMGRNTLGNQYVWCTPLEVAIHKGHYTIMKMLIEADCSLSPILGWTCTADVPQKLHDERPDLVEWLLFNRREVKSLFELCRKTINRTLDGGPLDSQVSLLPLPTSVKHDLAFAVLDDC